MRSSPSSVRSATDVGLKRSQIKADLALKEANKEGESYRLSLGYRTDASELPQRFNARRVHFLILSSDLL